MDDPTSNSHDANSRTSKQDSGDPPGCNSEISSIDDGHPGTDDGYEGDSSNSEDDCNWLVDLDERRSLLPNFWLILQVENDHVDVYFHCRFVKLCQGNTSHYMGKNSCRLSRKRLYPISSVHCDPKTAFTTVFVGGNFSSP